MATVRQIEERIFKVEGFRVRLRHLDGRDVRGDRASLPPYPYGRAMKNALSVSRWKERRFRSRYAGFDVEVVRRGGAGVHGATLLATVRDDYLDDE